MMFRDLESMDLAEFIRRGRAPGALWGFVHIPKTAGVALMGALAGRRRPYFNIFPKAYRDDPDEHRAALVEAVEAFLAAYANRAPDAGPGLFSGHLERSQIDSILDATPDLRLVTYLRDPVDRAISHYRYCLTPEHPLHAAFAKRFPTLMDFVAARRNFQSKFIVGADVSSVDQAVDFISRRFALVGTTEMYAFSNRTLAGLLGLPPFETPRLNVTRSISANDIEVTEATRQAIAEINHLDVAVYRYVAGLLARQLDSRAESSA